MGLSWPVWERAVPWSRDLISLELELCSKQRALGYYDPVSGSDFEHPPRRVRSSTYPDSLG